jgi:hypothetical protein
MSDVIFLAIVIGFFAVTTLLVRACGRIVGEDEPEVIR